MPTTPTRTDVLVVGAGPAGSAAAAWAARAGRDVVLADAATFPRDKTCGDGLTPRAIAELDRLDLGDWVRTHTVNQGLRAHGFGQTLHLPWPGGTLPDHGSAVPRTELDAGIRETALKAGATGVEGSKAVDATLEGGRVRSVTFRRGDGSTHEIACERLVVADGVRSGLGKVLGYGWIFPLGGGQVNVGVGTLATTRRPADVAVKPLMRRYTDERRADFGLTGEQRMPTSALLPMGGAVSNVAGPNWALVGDAAACVNPLNGEGIDYGLETGRLVALHLDDDLATVWPALLRDHYGEAFSIARRLAGVFTVPRTLAALGPVGMRSDWLMTLALRWMGNLVTDEDRDRAARVWRWAGRRSVAVDARPPFT
ncbi:MAG: FAD-dependent monooxygenase [Micrococcales bacterium]|nr:FAD-dependent monooxygenase [Micrococcales bacterium]